MCAYFFHVESRTQHLNHTSKPFFFWSTLSCVKRIKNSIYVHRDGNIEMITLHIQGPFKPLKNLFCCYLRTMMIRLSIFRYMCMLFLFLCAIVVVGSLLALSFIHPFSRETNTIFDLISRAFRFSCCYYSYWCWWCYTHWVSLLPSVKWSYIFESRAIFRLWNPIKFMVNTNWTTISNQEAKRKLTNVE